MSLGFTEILLIALFILIVFGAKRIPELARAMGRASYEFKKATRKEVGRYDMPGELWKGVRKLVLLALLLALFWFARECYLAWNIFGG